jgi:cytochrome c biogenesis protein CcdA
MNKLIDLRFVIGLFFTIIGILILVYSFVTKVDVDNQSVNRCGSIAFIIFGVVMIIISLGKDSGDELLE